MFEIDCLYGVQTYFFIKKINEIYRYEVIT
jgi:hypothetical protein